MNSGLPGRRRQRVPLYPRESALIRAQ